MAYSSKQQLQAFISNDAITDFLDDDGDGTEDPGLLDAIIAACSVEADGFVSSIYPVPFSDPAPSKIRAATTVFVCEAFYARRLTPDQANPFRQRADMWRQILKEIGTGDVPLDESYIRGFEPGFAVTVPLAVNKTTM